MKKRLTNAVIATEKAAHQIVVGLTLALVGLMLASIVINTIMQVIHH